MMFIESPFLGYPTCLIFAQVVWWSTALGTARTTRRGRPGRSLTSGCITSFEFFLAKMWYAVAMLVDMKAVYTFKMSDQIKYMWVGGWRHRGRHGQLGGEDQGGHWHEDVTHQLKFSRKWFAVVMVVDMKVVYTFNTSDHIMYMWVGGRQHCGRREQQGREDQGCCWHQDVSLCLEFSSTRTWYAMAMVVDRRIVYTFNMSDHIKYMWVGGGRHCRQGQQGGENQGGR